MRVVFLVLLFTACSLLGCSGAPENVPAAGKNATDDVAKSKLDSAGTKRLMALLNDYYALKDALVATNAPKADAAATKLSKDAGDLMAVLQAGDKDMLHPHLDTIILKTKDIRGMMDESCEHKRIHFEAISNNMYALLQKADLKNAGVYQQYCPMALNDKGAYWLSNERDIKNPYFGSKMLECGEITDTIN